VHYSFNQPVTPVEPHPLTLAAVQKAADALAEAQKAGDKEADNRKEIETVGTKDIPALEQTQSSSVRFLL
jgi:hypothetical protein